MDYKKLLQDNGFDKYFSSIKKKLKNKRTVIYGAGELFRYIWEHYDFSDLNIIAISDMSFNNSSVKEVSGIPAVVPSKIKEYNPDCILLAVLSWQNVMLKNYEQNIFDKKTAIFPLFKQKSDSANFCEKLFYYYPNFTTASWLNACRESQKDKIYKSTMRNYKKLEKKMPSKMRVAFLCFDDSRWKCQTLYDLLAEDEKFEPVILLTRLYTQKADRAQTKDEFFKSYQFFKDKGMNIELAYDIEKDEYLDLSQFSPNYIFYQLPFYCHPLQSPKVTSKFALTAYVPYCTGTSLFETSADMDFRNHLWRYYLGDEGLKEFYSSIMRNNGDNIRVVGHPSLDIYYKKFVPENTGKCQVLYCPHHSMEENSPLHLSTFLENGKFILDYAKKHSEINWVFRPHPLLTKVLKGYWSEEEIADYFKSWKEIGRYDYEGDYTQTFLNSDVLINDCGFFPEFFPTGRPIIQLINPKVVPYDRVSSEIIETCYQSHNNEELLEFLQLLIEKKEDPMREKRLNLLEKLNIINTSAALNILNDMREIINE